MTTEMRVILYLVGIPLSVIVMAFSNKKLAPNNRAPYGVVIVLAVSWPVGLFIFYVVGVSFCASDIATTLGNLSISKRLKKFIEGE